ncbi:MAG: hypothetical protein ACKV2V_05850, partial [Blastocatellia bacterium]
MKKAMLILAICFLSLVYLPKAVVSEGKEKATVTFSKDVAPILQKRCEECHHQGGMAPMSLATFEEARPWAKSIKEKVVTREMPPFHAAGPVGRYVDDPRPADAEIETIKAWVDGGAPKGDPKHSPAPRAWPDGWKLGQPDLVLTINKPYTVKRDNKDEYVFFAFDYIFPEDTWMQGVEIRPGNRKAVHHANIHTIPADYQNPPEGFASGRTMVGQFLTGWAPGGTPRLQPKGYGSMMRKGTRLGIQLHYAPAKDVVTDQTSIGFYFADGHITKRTQLLHGGTRNIVIPPGEANYQIIEKRTFPADALVRAFTAHMHVRGKSFVVKLHYPDGKVETAFEIPRYDFNWQRGYPLAQPIPVPKGTVAEYIATWDNSAKNKFNPDPAQVVKWGENTTDEMMGGFLNYEAAGETLDIHVKKGRRVSAPESTSNAPSQAAPFELIKQTLDVGMVVSDREKAREFYGEILGYKELPAFKTPDGGEMLRFQAGTTTLKLNVLPKTPPKYPGGTNAGIGFRLLT